MKGVDVVSKISFFLFILLIYNRMSCGGKSVVREIGVNSYMNEKKQNLLIAPIITNGIRKIIIEQSSIKIIFQSMILIKDYGLPIENGPHTESIVKEMDSCSMFH